MSPLWILTAHARRRMWERGISESHLADAFLTPHKVVAGRGTARKMLSKAAGRQLAVVFVEEAGGLARIITAYWLE